MHVPAAAPERRWKNVPLSRERDPRRSRWLLTLFLGAVASLVPLAVYVVHQMECVRVRYKIEEMRGKRDRLEETERRLRIERATIQSLPSVEARAGSELGLVHPGPGQVVVAKTASPGRGAAASRAPDARAEAR